MLQHHSSVSWVPLQEATGGAGACYVQPACSEASAASRSGCWDPGLWTLSPPAAERRWLQDYKVRQRYIPFLPPEQQTCLGPRGSCAPLPGCPVQGCTDPALPLHSNTLPSSRGHCGLGWALVCRADVAQPQVTSPGLSYPLHLLLRFAFAGFAPSLPSLLACTHTTSPRSAPPQG